VRTRPAAIHLVIGACLAALLAAHAPAAPAQHAKEFWRDLVNKKSPPPPADQLPAMLTELSGYLGSTDPELRDDIAYTVLSSWIYRQRIVPVELRRTLMNEWIGNLSKGIGDRDSDSVLHRSFSALALGILAILDNEAPFLERAEFEHLLAAALAYLRNERDVRGFDPDKGWMHSAAHTADLLRFLARSRHLEPAGQATILSAISEKVSVVDHVFTHGEDERFARVVHSIVLRADFDEPGFTRWVKLVAVRPPGMPTPASLVAGQNRRHLLVSLYAVLAMDTRDLPSLHTARATVLEAIKPA
jgi:hypothetical protein